MSDDGEGFKIASAYVSISANTDGLAEEIQAKIQEAADEAASATEVDSALLDAEEMSRQAEEAGTEAGQALSDSAEAATEDVGSDLASQISEKLRLGLDDEAQSLMDELGVQMRAAAEDPAAETAAYWSSLMSDEMAQDAQEIGDRLASELVAPVESAGSLAGTSLSDGLGEGFLSREDALSERLLRTVSSLSPEFTAAGDEFGQLVGDAFGPWTASMLDELMVTTQSELRNAGEQTVSWMGSMTRKQMAQLLNDIEAGAVEEGPPQFLRPDGKWAETLNDDAEQTGTRVGDTLGRSAATAADQGAADAAGGGGDGGGGGHPLLMALFGTIATFGPAMILSAMGAVTVGIAAYVDKSNADVKAQYSALGNSISTSFKGAAEIISGPIASALGILESDMKTIGPEIVTVFAAAAPYADAIAKGLGGFFENVLPGAAAGLRSLDPDLSSLADSAARLGTGLGGFFEGLGRGANGATVGVEALTTDLAQLGPDLGDIIGDLSNGLGPALHDVSDVAMPVAQIFTSVVNALPPAAIRTAADAIAFLYATFRLGSLAGVIADGTTFMGFIRSIPGTISTAVAPALAQFDSNLVALSTAELGVVPSSAVLTEALGRAGQAAQEGVEPNEELAQSQSEVGQAATELATGVERAIQVLQLMGSTEQEATEAADQFMANLDEATEAARQFAVAGQEGMSGAELLAASMTTTGQSAERLATMVNAANDALGITGDLATEAAGGLRAEAVAAIAAAGANEELAVSQTEANVSADEGGGSWGRVFSMLTLVVGAAGMVGNKLGEMAGVGQQTTITMGQMSAELDQLGSHSSDVTQSMTALGTGFALMQNTLHEVPQGLSDVDQALTQMQASDPAGAAKAYQALATSMENSGMSAQDVAADFPQYTAAVQQSKQATSSLTSGTDAFTTALSTAYKTMVTSSQTTAQSAIAALNLKSSQTALASSLYNTVSAYTLAQARGAGYATVLDAMNNATGAQSNAVRTDTTYVNVFNTVMSTLNSQMVLSSQHAAQATVAALNLGTGQNTLNETLANSLTAYNNATTEANAYKTALVAASGDANNLFSNQTTLDQAMKTLTTSFKSNKYSIDDNTDAGIANRQAIEGVVTAAQGQATAVYQSEVNTVGATKAYSDANGIMETAKTKFVNAAIAAGGNATQVQTLANTLFKLPPATATQINANTTPAMNAVNSIINKINSMKATITVNAQTNSIPQRAGGGPVSANNTYLVGEEGPEIVTFGANGYVTPNSALKAASLQGAGAGGGVGGAPAQYNFNFGDMIIKGIVDLTNPKGMNTAAKQMVWQLRNALTVIEKQYGVGVGG